MEKAKTLTEKQRRHFQLAPDVETEHTVITRFLHRLRQIALAHPGKKVLVVSHGGVMRMLLVRLGFGKREQLPYDSIQNTGYIKLDSDGLDFFIKETQGINKSS